MLLLGLLPPSLPSLFRIGLLGVFSCIQEFSGVQRARFLGPGIHTSFPSLSCLLLPLGTGTPVLAWFTHSLPGGFSGLPGCIWFRQLWGRGSGSLKLGSRPCFSGSPVVTLLRLPTALGRPSFSLPRPSLHPHQGTQVAQPCRHLDLFPVPLALEDPFSLSSTASGRPRRSPTLSAFLRGEVEVLQAPTSVPAALPVGFWASLGALGCAEPQGGRAACRGQHTHGFPASRPGGPWRGGSHSPGGAWAWTTWLPMGLEPLVLQPPALS